MAGTEGAGPPRGNPEYSFPWRSAMAGSRRVTCSGTVSAPGSMMRPSNLYNDRVLRR
jgi:hypothetical protein